MKTICTVLLALSVLLTPLAQAKTCSGTWCNYIDTNDGFESGGANWSYWGVSFPLETTCYSNNHAAEMQNTEWIQRPYWNVDNTYSSFNLQFRAFLPGDSDNYYDELKITVTNLTTNVSEIFYLHGSSYNGAQCGKNVIPLANNYSNADVTVKFQSGTFSSHNWQIDDVGFFAFY